MPIELKIPSVGESITEVEVGEWLKHEGDSVHKDENLVFIESEKATVELPAPQDAVLSKILKQQGDKARPGETVGLLEEPSSAPPRKEKKNEEPARGKAEAKAPEKPPIEGSSKTHEAPRIMPAAERLLAQNKIAPEKIKPTGPGARILKEDVLRHIEAVPPAKPARTDGSREEEVVRMTPLRRKIAERLVEAQQTAALLTTFNEIDMSEVIALRKQFGEVFQQQHGIKLGFMSFFVKATIEALKQNPQLNAEIRGQGIVFRNYYDIGIAIGGGRGLVVPVMRNAERLSFAEVEKAIGDFGRRAKENKLTPEELMGGTFTITNGGIYGSMLSTPIINPPQSGILGMHAIQERPVAKDGAVVIRPMMYVALTYDHRVVDGREAVTFLRRIREIIETPARMLLEI